MARRKGASKWSAYAAPYIVEKLLSYSERMADALLDAPARHAHDLYANRKIAAEHMMIAQSIAGTPIHWIAKDLCEVVAQTYESVPEWSPEQVLPCPSGIVMLERSPAAPVRFTGVAGSEVSIDAVAWSSSPSGRLLVALLAKGSLIHDAAAKDLDSYLRDAPLYNVYSLNLDPAKPQGAGRLSPEMLEGDDATPPAYATDEAEMTAVLSLVGTIWLLMGQTGITQTSEFTPPRTTQARKAAERGEDVPDVVVTEHRISAPAGKARNTGSGGGREVSSRWWVRGHWRQQACGPGWSQRKPVYIAPHTSGAADAKVDSRPRVHRHRT